MTNFNALKYKNNICNNNKFFLSFTDNSVVDWKKKRQGVEKIVQQKLKKILDNHYDSNSNVPREKETTHRI